MSDKDWQSQQARCLGVRLEGEMINEVDDRGRPISGRSMLMLLNALDKEIPFLLPEHESHQFWRMMFDTGNAVQSRRFKQNERYALQPRSLAVLQLRAIRPRRAAGLVNWFSGGKPAPAVDEPEPEQPAPAALEPAEVGGNGKKPAKKPKPDDAEVETPARSST
jgi:hypothetical protein